MGRFNYRLIQEIFAGRSHQPAPPICLDFTAASGATGDAFFRQDSSLKHTSTAAPRLPGSSTDGDGLFAYVNTLRLSVKARVAAEQERGLSLSEIVAQVRTMVRLAKEDPQRPGHIPLFAFGAISRQALAWCVEAYEPVLFAAGDVNVTGRTERAAQPLRPILPATVEALDRFSSSSNNPVKE